MARATLALAVLAVLCAGAMADYIEVTVKWDNSLTQTNRNEMVIHEELSTELCRVPISKIGTLKTINKSTPTNEESWGYYACMPVKPAEAGKILTNCKNTMYRRLFKEEVMDRTMPDQVAEDIGCTLRPGSPQGRRLA